MALTDNLIAYWKLDGNSTDAVGSYNGTDTSISYDNAYGKINQGALFNGSTSKIALGNNANLTQANCTLSFWVVGKGTNSNYRYIWSRGRNVDEYAAFGIVVNSGGNLAITAGGAVHDLITWATLTNGDYIVVTCEGATKTVKVYRNGTQHGSNITTTNAYNLNNTYDTAIGRAAAFNNYSFDGKLDEIGYWSRALTSTEVTSLYNSGSGLQYPFGSTAVTSPAFLLNFIN